MGSPKDAGKKTAKARRPRRRVSSPELLADLERAAAALEKQDAGEKLSSRDGAALRRVTKRFAEASAKEHYARLPKRLWVQWSGRQPNQINEQALRHNLPLAGATIDLARLAPSLHELLAKRDDSQNKPNRGERALELIRREELLMKRMERLAKQRVLLERKAVHATFQLVADMLRKGGLALQEQFGNEAHVIYDETLTEASRLVLSLTGADDQQTLG